MMLKVHVGTTIGFQESEVPPTSEINSLGHFQAESAGRAWLVRKSSISPTTFIFTSDMQKIQRRDV